jgi:hypothetical protein
LRIGWLLGVVLILEPLPRESMRIKALLLVLALLWLLPKTRSSWAEGGLVDEDDEARRRPREARVNAGRVDAGTVDAGRVIAGRGAGDDPVPVT